MAEKYRSSSMQSFDPNNLGKERYWTANKITSEQIDAYLSEGHTAQNTQDWFRNGHSLQYHASLIGSRIW
jgi:hypothetical protein